MSESMQSSITRAARTAHEANRILCVALGDYSQKAWDDAPGWQKESAAAGVQSILDNPAITVAQLHQAWLDHRVADGWKYGRVKDADKKEHPALVPYENLPPDQKLRDEMFNLVVRAVLRVP